MLRLGDVRGVRRASRSLTEKLILRALEHSRYASFGRLQILGLGDVRGVGRARRSLTEKLILRILEHSRCSNFGRL